jgi:hypothetical protein
MMGNNNEKITRSRLVGVGTFCLAVPYALYKDYNLKKHKGVGLKDAREILEKYNKDLIQKIVKESEKVSTVKN